MLQISNVLLPPSQTVPSSCIFSLRGMLGARERAQGKQVEKGEDVHSREIKIILGRVEVEDNAMVRLGPVDRAKQFHSLSEIALDVKSFPAPDGEFTLLEAMLCLSVSFYTLRYGTSPS